MGLQLGRQMPEFLLCTELRIDLIVVDDVVSVLAAFARLQDGRRIKMSDTEFLKIRNQPAGMFKMEAVVELQSIRGERYRFALLCGQTIKAFA